MEKINIGNNGFIYPMPVALLGTNADNKANFMALGWVMRANANPPMLTVAVNKNHLSNKSIRDNKTFSVNFPNTEMIEITDYCGLVSGKREDKSELFEVYYGELNSAPMIKEFPLSLECKLHDVYEMPTNDLFIGEIVATYTEEQYLTDGKPDIKKINPAVLTMPDNNYWNIGENIGKAWNIGKNLKKN
ncbi:flavin reductase family protein [Methanobacterium oryzae]|uniref:flavin reductase family protein n=1 Tax=Methanobacterium oryzae TaxID=69540 RepID=UPI003D215CB9